jgi:hypothetical protein
MGFLFLFCVFSGVVSFVSYSTLWFFPVESGWVAKHPWTIFYGQRGWGRPASGTALAMR